MSYQLASSLNQACNCSGADIEQLQQSIEAQLQAALPNASLATSHPHLFSSVPVFLAEEHAQRMQQVIAAIERVVENPGYRLEVLADVTAIAGPTPAAGGVFLGYDFHITDSGPQLVEINTNAGGAALNLQLVSVQLGCCMEARDLMGPSNAVSLGAAFVAMFRNEWRLARGTMPLESIAIVDERPMLQYLYPEFLLFKELFETHGIRAAILDPGQLSLHEGRLEHAGERFDLVYNRLTDFYFERGEHVHLLEAYRTGAAVFTPGPHHHALYADKRHLALLSSAARLKLLGVAHEDIASLVQGIPHTELVHAADAERWWAERKRWFFKPVRGYGSKGVYRGDKLTRGVFAEILRGGYIAQALVAPSEREHAASQAGVLKVDFRNYVYEGEVQLLAARLYRGQVTNFRTPAGGFAPVFLVSEERLARAVASRESSSGQRQFCR